jgi:FtsZ-binding cell division protein ZapB|tara:strand:- start:573 stop:872 length:300 start_codon:yes stop_codon:yes gene_type:complete
MDVNTVLSLSIPAATLLIGWLGGKRKKAADTEVIEGNALKVMQESYTQMVSDMRERYDELQNQVDDLQELNKTLSKSVKDLTKVVDVLKEENEKLKNGH